MVRIKIEVCCAFFVVQRFRRKLPDITSCIISQPCYQALPNMWEVPGVRFIPVSGRLIIVHRQTHAVTDTKER